MGWPVGGTVESGALGTLGPLCLAYPCPTPRLEPSEERPHVRGQGRPGGVEVGSWSRAALGRVTGQVQPMAMGEAAHLVDVVPASQEPTGLSSSWKEPEESKKVGLQRVDQQEELQGLRGR